MNHQRGLQCCTAWHLWRFGLELAMHDKVCSLTWVKTRGEHGVYHSSIQNLADYFGVARQSGSRAANNLLRKGWWEVVERRDNGKTGRAIKVEMLRPKDFHPLTHDEWVKIHGDASCYKCDAMPWENEPKDKLAIILHRDSKGNVLWHPNMVKSLRNTGASDSEIELAYHAHVAALDKEPKRASGWRADAFKWMAEFRKARAAK
jgi:hypothetical protein